MYVESSTATPAVTWVTGRAPASSAGPGEERVVVSEGDPPWPVEVGLSERAAVALDARPGTRLDLQDDFGHQVVARVSGVYSADDPDDPAWTVARRELLSPAVGTSDGVERTSAAALVSAEALPDLRIAVPPDQLTQRIAFLPDPDEVRWEQAPALGRDVVELKTRPGLDSGQTGWESALDLVLADASTQVASARGRAQFPLVGLLATTALTVVLAAQAGAPTQRSTRAGAREGGDAARPRGRARRRVDAGGGGRHRAGWGVTAALLGSAGGRWVLPLLVVTVSRHPVFGALEAGRATRARRLPANRAARRVAGATAAGAPRRAGGRVPGAGRPHVRRPPAARPRRGRPGPGQRAHRLGTGRRVPAGPPAAAAAAAGAAAVGPVGGAGALLRGGPRLRGRAARTVRGRRRGGGGPARLRQRLGRHAAPRPAVGSPARRRR